MILTVDFGTSVTKVALWGLDGLVTLARAELTTIYPGLGRAEQEPFGWWTSVVVACAEARAQAPEAFGVVEVVCSSAARQTFVPVTAAGDPIGKGLLWSDRRAGAEAATLAERLGGNEAVRRRTGVPLDAGAVAAKVRWLAEHEPARLEAAAWLLSPRDLVNWRLTGVVATDPTLGARTGLYDLEANLVEELAGAATGRLPPQMPSDHVVGRLRGVPAAELGLRPGIPVVVGAGDRQCEVLGAGASDRRPMVSWGTTANVSLPVADRPDASPSGAVVSRGAIAGWVLEGGLSAAGSFLAWLGRLLGRGSDELADLAAGSPPGARGVVAVPWLDGARAPWWREDARAGFLGLATAHDAGDLAQRGARVGGVGRHPLPRARDHGAPGGPPGGGRDPGRSRERPPAVGGGPHLGHRAAGPAPPIGRGGVGRRGTVGGKGCRARPRARSARSAPARDPTRPDGRRALRRAATRGGVDRCGRALPVRHVVGLGALMEVAVAYGRSGALVRVPDDATVVGPTELPGLADEAGAVVAALRAPVAGPPIGELVGARDQVVVVFPDLTRPMPNRTVLPPLLAELERLGAGPDRVELLCATGTHRQATAAELVELVGPEIVGRYRIHDHRADDGRHVMVGRVDGVPVRLDAHYVDATVRICTGFVEPHFFAGWSGGPKGVCPGLAATETILGAHSPERIADPAAAFTVTEGNPVHQFIREAVALDPPTLSLDVAINSARQLTGVFAGPLPEGHLAARRFVAASAVHEVPGRYEVVVSTNGGHPLDRNLYQAVKGMAAAERVVTDGGDIVLAAACGDGIPDGGAFARLLAAAAGPRELVGADGRGEVDRWQAQVLGRVLQRARVWLHADGLAPPEITAAHLLPAPDIQAAIDRALDLAGPAGALLRAAPGPAHGGQSELSPGDRACGHGVPLDAD